MTRLMDSIVFVSERVKKNNNKDLNKIAGLMLLVCVGILFIPDFGTYLGTDFGVYFNSGKLLTQGMVPYKDFFDHKTPLIYFYFAAWIKLFGTGWFSIKFS